MRRDDRPLEKHTINLFKGDLQKVQEYFPRPGASKIIRDLVHNFIKRTEAAAQKDRPALALELKDDDLD